MGSGADDGARNRLSRGAVGGERHRSGEGRSGEGRRKRRRLDDYDGENLDFVAFITSDEAWPEFADACASILDDAACNRVDRAWVEEALSFPATSTLVRELAPFNPIVAHRARKALATAFATKCAPALKRALAVCDAETAASYAAGEVYDITAEQVARRSLSAYCLQALAALDPEFLREFDGTPRRARARVRRRAQHDRDGRRARGAVKKRMRSCV